MIGVYVQYHACKKSTVRYLPFTTHFSKTGCSQLHRKTRTFAVGDDDSYSDGKLYSLSGVSMQDRMKMIAEVLS